MNTSFETSFYINCKGDACTGDNIMFIEAVFAGSYKKLKYLSDRRIFAKILKDSYGSEKQQHTATIEVLFSDGIAPLEIGKKTTHKLRNIYKNSTMRQEWANENDRMVSLDDKHIRGDEAREMREIRKNNF